MLTPYYGEQSNQRTDEYGEKLFLLRRITTEVRRNVPKDFVVGVKLNSADFVDRKAAATSDEKVLQHVRDIVSWGLIDFLEISGGDYENPGGWIYILGPTSMGTWQWTMMLTRVSWSRIRGFRIEASSLFFAIFEKGSRIFA